jgi:SAM-dependent methyltransferase
VATANVYTRRWFSTFLGRIDAAIVDREIAFLRRHLAAGARVLDLCCGTGRHAAPLSDAGFRIVGLDRDASALRDARSWAPAADFVRADMRQLPLETGSVDAAICMWQSFGHLDTEGNEAILGGLARVLLPNGCLVMDLYHLDFHAAHQGERTIERDGERVFESRRMHGDRLRATLRYESSGESEEFEWQLFTPSAIGAMARRAGLEVRLVCAEFDEHVAASSERARMQLVFRGM